VWASCISAGDGLAGYLNRTELTQERFIPNPFSSKPEARLYKTGDLARYLSDGNIEFFRSDGRAGKDPRLPHRVSEIETVLSQHPAVRETVVIAHKNISDGKRQ